MALKVNLVDVPNKRKVHSSPIPLVGGIAIALSSVTALLLSSQLLPMVKNYMGLIISGSVIFVMGIVDDRFDIKAKYKLIIQLACAYTISSYGVRISSLYGLFGIYDLPEVVQYLLTIIVITGTVNAFNLMDGVDGLAGGLSLLGFALFMFIGLYNHNYLLSTISVSFIGAILVFLKHNFSENKIFMGDSGSLFLGYILISFGISTIEHPGAILHINQSSVLLSVAAFFAIPLLDSIRVYRGRIKNGNSPFKADKTHLHHLFLSIGLKHQKISLVILLLVSVLVLFILGYNRFLSLSITLCVILLFYTIVTRTLRMLVEFNKWKEKIKQIEKN
ncbi:MAG: undecaprenyl/decaprenyl-phosphate alpha-N-acetylglucosaminyl 1-phosphate transferase [Bacteroidia bacterium]|nr:undecaprenyl/decaprenyl-phosphate alpha-N-acetylglucosaminyl 1-phosphate transferase [Bacteroidia bacterium]